MPIPDEALNRRFIPRVLSPSTTVAELLYLLAEQAEPERYFAVVQIAADLYDVLALDDLSGLAGQPGVEVLQLALGQVPGLLQGGAPLVQSQVGEARATREMAARPRRRLVVLNDDGALVGVLASTMLGGSRGSLLDLIHPPPAAVLGPEQTEGLTAPMPPAHLNTRFDGVAPGAPLVVGRRVPLIVAVGPPTVNTSAESSQPFAFDFAGTAEPVTFIVNVSGDPTLWTIRVDEPTMVVAPPGTTTQEAEFTVIARQPGRSQLHLTVVRADTGATLQHVWLWVTAAYEAAAEPSFAVQPRVEAAVPLDAAGVSPASVELTITAAVGGATVEVRADLPDARVHEICQIPASAEAIQNATLRLRQELERIVYYPNGPQSNGPFPFANKATSTVDRDVARAAYVALADAGQQVWNMIFNPPGASDGLRRLAADLRKLPLGSRVQVALNHEQFIVPWALLYDRPGPIDATTLRWDGFWGYRYILDVFPLIRGPQVTIADAPPQLLLLFNDDHALQVFTARQERFVRETLASAVVESVWGTAQVQEVLKAPPPATLVYCYCHGDHASGAVPNPKRTVTELASESAVLFSGAQRLRLTDLRELPAGPLTTRPLVFLNACEGAAQDAFYYDGFMPFFIQQQLARGFIGAEVKAPQLLGHQFGLQFLQMFAAGMPVGEILWRLRRHYLDTHHNILAFNYSLYCHADTRLATPLLPPSATADRVPAEPK